MAPTGEDLTEYRSRLARVRQAMSQEGFDVLLVVDDDDQDKPPRGDTRYLCNFSAGNRKQAVILPLEGEPTLVLPPGALHCVPDWAIGRSWIDDMRCTPREGWPPPRGLASDIVLALKERGLEKARIGVCGRQYEEEDKAVRAALPDATFVPAEVVDKRGIRRDLVEKVRAIKSPWEVAYLVNAQACAEIGQAALFEAAQPGIRHNEAIAAGKVAAIRAGADECSVYMSSGTTPWVWGPYRGDLAFQQGDLVSVEFNARVNGYVAQRARAYVLGTTPTIEQDLVLKTGVESQRQMVEHLAVGVTGGFLWDVGLKVVHEADLKHYGRYGHGMGLSIAESFDIMRGDANPIEEGFCIEVHAGLVSPRTKDSVLIGDQFIIQNGRARHLSELAGVTA